ncbi:MAG TPA: metallophosphoesterase [Galbitalea sp.]|nr:metallophosphoesterase [Galbitalea sp.]
MSLARGTAGQKTATALGAVAVAGAAAFAWGSLVERNRFTVRREHLPILSLGSRPLRILHLSDLHMAPWQTGKQDWIASLAALEPDFLINTGDNLGHIDGLTGVVRALEPFSGIPGAFVNGSNDYYGPVLKNPFTYFGPRRVRKYRPAGLDTEALESFFEGSLGWANLNNAARDIRVGKTRFELFGVNDAHRNWDRLDILPGAIEKLREDELDEAPAADGTVTLGVTHAPYRRVLDAFVTYGARAILAGHTHGGQVRIPGLPALVTNCDIPRDQAQGLSTWTHAGRTAWLNVSAGIGTSIYAPVRFACPPEAVLLTLTAPNET